MEMNEIVSKRLGELSWLYDTKDERYRAMAYGRASASVKRLQEPIEKLPDVTSIEGIGKSIKESIVEIMATGTCKRLETLKASSPPITVAEFEEMHGIGPKSAIQIWKQYGIGTMDALGKLIEEGKVDEDLTKKYRDAQAEKRVPLEAMLSALAPVLKKMKRVPQISRVEVAGSIRRGSARVKDADVVVCCKDEDRQKVFKAVQGTLGNPSDGSVKVGGEIQVDGWIRRVDVSITNDEAWGACLMYLTGSKEHNVLMRVLAKKTKMTLNEYGLFVKETQELIAGATELDIYEALGVPYFEPKERESWIVKSRLKI